MTELGEILEGLHRRYATKRFDQEKKLSPEQVTFLKEVLRLSPSSYGLQPWRFFFVEAPERKEELRPICRDQPQPVEAGVFIVFCRPTAFSTGHIEAFAKLSAETREVPLEALAGFKDLVTKKISSMSEDDVAVWCEKQVYIALGMLLSSCAQAGLDACPMEGFDKAAMDEALGLKEKGLRSVVCCAVGTRSEADEYATRPKVRFPMADVVETV